MYLQKTSKKTRILSFFCILLHDFVDFLRYFVKFLRYFHPLHAYLIDNFHLSTPPILPTLPEESFPHIGRLNEFSLHQRRGDKLT
jgi:hypothetical protein